MMHPEPQRNITNLDFVRLVLEFRSVVTKCGAEDVDGAVLVGFRNTEKY